MQAAARLKPGGLLHIGYNALPGWAAVEPLGRLMHDVSADVVGGNAARVRQALAAAKLLCEANAAYFVANPSANRRAWEHLKAFATNEFFWRDVYVKGAVVGELAMTPARAPFGVDSIRQAVLQLLMGNDVIPMHSSPAIPQSTGSQYHIPSAFNRAILTEPLSHRHPIVLASSVAGTGGASACSGCVRVEPSRRKRRARATALASGSSSNRAPTPLG